MTGRLRNPAAAKDPRKTWYGLASWKERRRHQLQAEPLCALCLAKGELTGATVADHIEPHAGDWNKFVLGALRSLCAECHDGLQPSFRHKPYRLDIGADGFPLDPRHPWYRGRV
jgi:5-methylcytosine-specific restriction protein A